MPRELILGTAGHIDHGKTSLVKALTGVDCDRLPEEKARGITIDIGFAKLDLDGYHLGIVDVPGHERFIRNMLAGATGIDLAILVIAADDGVMPQTREHLEILRLLQLQQGVIALTKTDLVDEITLQLREMEIRELVRDCFLSESPIIRTSATQGNGVRELKEALKICCAQIERKQASEWFRLAIDRAFIVQGHGTVVTGSVSSGTLAVGEELEWLPKGQLVRTRSLQNHDQVVSQIQEGMRAAINLVGVPLEEVKRGQELAKPGYLKASKVLSVQLLALKDQRHPIKHRTEARLHIGTAEVMVTVSLLNAELLNPGQSGLAQLFLKESVTAIWGQPFVLRNSSAETTLGGGQVLQPTGLKIRRSQPEMLQWMDRLRSNDIMERAEAVVWFRNYHGLTCVDLVREAGIARSQLAEVENSLIQNGKWLSIEQTEQRILLHRERWNELEERILAVLAKLHSEAPLLSHHDRQKVISQLAYIGDEGLIDWGIEELIRLKKISGDNRRIACSDFKPKLSQNQKKLKDRIVESLRTAGFAPPEPRSFANLAGGNAESLEDIFAVAVAEGLLVRVSHEIYLHADAEASMREAVRQVLASGRGVTVAEIRDILGTTRKFAVPLCEYLDRIGFTHREGDLRFLQVAN